jgi:hypothetical protein
VLHLARRQFQLIRNLLYRPAQRFALRCQLRAGRGQLVACFLRRFCPFIGIPVSLIKRPTLISSIFGRAGMVAAQLRRPTRFRTGIPELMLHLNREPQHIGRQAPSSLPCSGAAEIGACHSRFW